TPGLQLRTRSRFCRFFLTWHAPQAVAALAVVVVGRVRPTTVARMLNMKVVIPANIKIPEKKRTVQTGFSATTVSMNGIEGLFHCHPCQKPPSQRVTKNPSPPTMKNQKLQFASASECSVV